MKKQVEPQRPPWISEELWEDMRVFSVLSEAVIARRVAERVSITTAMLLGENTEADA
jgi:hypothetical protein